MASTHRPPPPSHTYEEPSAPPYPGSHSSALDGGFQHGHKHGASTLANQRNERLQHSSGQAYQPDSVPGNSPASVYVAPPTIEMQPWARNVWKWLTTNTTGVARVDLRRPTAPRTEFYQSNLFFLRRHGDHGPAASALTDNTTAAAGGRRGFAGRAGGRRAAGGRQQGQQQQQAQGGYGNGGSPYGYGVQGADIPVLAVTSSSGGGDLDGYGSPRGLVGPLFTGARIKITRSFLVGQGGPTSPPGHQPWLDCGVGVNLDIDGQRLEPVARLKIKNLVTFKAWPGLIKLSRSIPLGPLALKVRYDVPVNNLHRFWEPPARLMVRLDSAAGSGFHLSPAGIEFDEKLLRFGTAMSVRASASLLFPRQIPFDPEEDGLRLQVHRLSLKSIW